MNRKFIVLGVMLGLVVAGVSPAQAEIYKYHDQQGNVCFTDDWAQVPEDQRPQAETRQAVDTDAAAREVEYADAVKAEGAVEPDAPPADIVVDEKTIAALKDRKQELASEFSGLMAEKYALLQEKEKLTGLAGRDVEAREAYEDKAIDLNNRIADYKYRRDAFQKECELVNKTLKPSPPEEEDAERLTE